MKVLDFSQPDLTEHKGMAQYARNVIPRLARILDDQSEEYVIVTTSSEVKQAREVLLDWKVNLDVLKVARSLVSLYTNSLEARKLFGVTEVDFVSTYPRYPIWNRGRNTATIHDITAYKHSRWYFIGTKKDNFFRKLFTKKRIDRLVESSGCSLAVVSESTERDLKLCFLDLDLDTRVHYVGNGASHIHSSEDNPIRRKRERYFCYVGSSSIHKNLKNMILGFEMFSKSNPAYVLKIAGCNRPKHLDGRSLSNVEFLGPVSEKDKCELIENAMAMLYLSHAEGFGIPPLESILLGTPVLVSDIRVFSETLPEWNLKVDPFNPISISEGMNKLVADYERQLEYLLPTRQTILERYSWDAVALRYMKMLSN